MSIVRAEQSRLVRGEGKKAYMGRFKIEDFPEAVQAQIREQLGQRPATPPPAIPKHHASGTPNKTEADYQRIHLRGLDARYEALTFRLENGHRYTPDWIVFKDGAPTECHEVKGAYALGSQQRARMAFDQARVEFPGLMWVWARKTADGWEIEPPLRYSELPHAGTGTRSALCRQK